MPSPGRITYFHPPGGLGVRVDSAAYQGYVIPPYYDSLVGKLIVHGRTRTEALMRLRRALDEFIVDGVETTLPLFRTLVRNTDIQNGLVRHSLARGIPQVGGERPAGLRRGSAPRRRRMFDPNPRSSRRADKRPYSRRVGGFDPSPVELIN